MLLFRPAREGDLDAIHALSLTAGVGLTTLPPDRAVLQRKIRHSVASFAKKVEHAGEEYYLFVLEDTGSGDVIGTSGIYATVGQSVPFYSYRLLHLTQVSHKPEMKVDTKLLQLVNDYAGATELATLYLHPEKRTGGTGAFLSRARYLMMAAFPERFADKAMAEIRGFVNADGKSPFWEAIGRHFFRMDFEEADRINGMGNSQFIADLMPKFPIYTTLLPDEAQAAIGRPHDQARGAVRLLAAEGFRFGGAVDIFDAGPCYEAPRREIRTIRKTRRLHVAAIDEAGETAGDVQMIALPDIADFRVVMAPADRIGKDGIRIGSAAARTLAITVGAPVLVAPMRQREQEADRP